MADWELLTQHSPCPLPPYRDGEQGFGDLPPSPAPTKLTPDRASAGVLFDPPNTLARISELGICVYPWGVVAQGLLVPASHTCAATPSDSTCGAHRRESFGARRESFVAFERGTNGTGTSPAADGFSG